MRIIERGQHWSVRWSDLTVALGSDRLLRSARKRSHHEKVRIIAGQYSPSSIVPGSRTPKKKTYIEKAVSMYQETAAANSRNVENHHLCQRWSVCWSDLTVALGSHRLLRISPLERWGATGWLPTVAVRSQRLVRIKCQPN